MKRRSAESYLNEDEALQLDHMNKVISDKRFLLRDWLKARKALINKGFQRRLRDEASTTTPSV